MGASHHGVHEALVAEQHAVKPGTWPADHGTPCSHWGCPRTDGDPCSFHRGDERRAWPRTRTTNGEWQ